MTPDQYGFAIGQQIAAGGDKYLMGLQSNRQEQDLSLRQRAFEFEQSYKEKTYPLMEQQIANRTESLRLDAELQRQALDLQKTSMQTSALLAPHLAELDLLSRTGDPKMLSNYQFPTINVDASANPLLNQHAAAIASNQLRAYYTRLLDANEIRKTWGETSDKLLAVSRMPVGSPIKMQLQAAAVKVRDGGMDALNSFELNTLLPWADKTAYSMSPEKMAYDKYQQEVESKKSKAKTDEATAYGKIAGNIFSSDALKAAAEKRLIENLNSRGTPSGMDATEGNVPGGVPTNMPKATSYKPSKAQVEAFQTYAKQAAKSVAGGTNAIDVISKVSDELMKLYQLPATARNRMATQTKALELLQSTGVNLPFTEEDLSSTSQTEE